MNDFVIVFLIPTFTAYAQCMGAGAIGCGLLFVEHWWKTKRQIRDELAAETEAALLEPPSGGVLQAGVMRASYAARAGASLSAGDMVTMDANGYVTKAEPGEDIIGVALQPSKNGAVVFKTDWP